MFLIENIKDFPKEIVVPEIEEEIQRDIKGFVSFAENMQGIKQLFELFEFNLKQMEQYCAMFYSDMLIKKDGKRASFIEVNALLINIISAGKTLTEAMETFLKTELGEEKAVEFKNSCLSKKYDEVFAYRFLLYLRNFAQHGNLPVSKKLNGRFCFDLAQILSTEHIKVGPAIKKSMESIYQEIVETYKGEPCIAFTATLDSYTLTVTEIYYCFWKTIEEDVQAISSHIQQILADFPELIYRGEEMLDGVVIYDIEEDGMMHFFWAEDNLWNAYVDCKKQAKNAMLYFKKEHMELDLQ